MAARRLFSLAQTARLVYSRAALAPRVARQPLRFASTDAPAPTPAPRRPSAASDFATSYNAGLEAFGRGDFAAAESQFRRALAAEPGSANAHYNLGNTLLHLDRPLDALKAYQESIRYQPNQQDVLINMANLYALKLGDMKQASLNYEAALRIAEDAEARFNYAVILDRSGDLEKAVEQYRKALEAGVGRADKYLRNAVMRLAGKRAGESGKN